MLAFLSLGAEDVITVFLFLFFRRGEGGAGNCTTTVFFFLSKYKQKPTHLNYAALVMFSCHTAFAPPPSTSS